VIVVDTSALMAVLLDEPEASRCAEALASAGQLAISAGSLAEAMVVAGRLGVRAALNQMIAGLNFEIVPVTASDARLIGDAYDRWGKSIHPAGLNLGDCFAYVLATVRGLPLLYVGRDFARTDVMAA
jgi:ribonuclease VapC